MTSLIHSTFRTVHNETMQREDNLCIAENRTQLAKTVDRSMRKYLRREIGSVELAGGRVKIWYELERDDKYDGAPAWVQYTASDLRKVRRVVGPYRQRRRHA